MQEIQLDISSLLMPISPEHPAGINLEYEQIYDEIREARESDPDYLPQDEWIISEPRKADWHKVRTLCENALKQQSKDLQLVCWLTEALTHLQGLTGTQNGLQLLCEFMTHFWLQCWPALDDEGTTYRYGKLNRLDRDISRALYSSPLLSQPESALAHWRKVLAFEHKICTWPDSRSDLILKEGDMTMESFDRLAAKFSSIEISRQAATLERLQERLDSLEATYFSLSQEEPHALFDQTRQTLSDTADFLQRLAERAIPDGNDMMSLSFAGGLTEATDSGADDIPVRNQAMSRDVAISQMLAIAHFFRQTEPSSPVPFLMDRAASWATMTLTEWLEEMLSDSGSLREINNVLKGQHKE
ncbi:type VI secretion system protein TssA [Rahnella woolbedingensis]|uniref:Type VI secretion system protein TssA n=1 Tax=Rahnella woolbedingensis TaxID=1510574 RepID=A0A419N2V4_9GAMM|nr:type VI secretion system protein TssA [Rahnella woolbedingensis]RJT36257.1 type VI secretion system protein TssA [Rahnella woolbedingensis]